jgi:hypothetical protein
MSTNTPCPITPMVSPHLPAAEGQPDRGNPQNSATNMNSLSWRRFVARPATRILIRPEPGFYVMRLRSGAPLVAAVIYRLCPMVIPQPTNVTGPDPSEWCRPLDRSPRYEARIDGKRVAIDRVWTARSLRRVSRAEFEFRSGPLRHRARHNPRAPEATPQRPVDLDAIPPLF